MGSGDAAVPLIGQYKPGVTFDVDCLACKRLSVMYTVRVSGISWECSNPACKAAGVLCSSPVAVASEPESLAGILTRRLAESVDGEIRAMVAEKGAQAHAQE
jgi:hypothetical protein